MMKKKPEFFRYELHTHTAEVSQCSRILAQDLVAHYRNIGCDGLCITDHFINGNTLVPSGIPWEDQVDWFCKGYQNAVRTGMDLGLAVFFGWEFSYRGTDFLTYGLDPQWLYLHPELPTLDLNAYCDLIHEQGGYIIHAHPFREASYIDMIRLLPRKVDAVEVFNSSRTPFENELADEFARLYGLPGVFGTDNHIGNMKQYGLTGLPFPVGSIRDLMQGILNGQSRNIKMPCDNM